MGIKNQNPKFWYLIMGLKNTIPNFWNWEWECYTVFPTQLGKDLTKEYLKKLGTEIPVHACLEDTKSLYQRNQSSLDALG